jgi:hypothetical protein
MLTDSDKITATTKGDKHMNKMTNDADTCEDQRRV